MLQKIKMNSIMGILYPINGSKRSDNTLYGPTGPPPCMSLDGNIDTVKQVGTLGHMAKKLNVMYCNPSIFNAEKLYEIRVGQDILGPTGISYSELNINNYSSFGCDNVVLINQLYLDTIYNIKCILSNWTAAKLNSNIISIWIDGPVTINSNILQFKPDPSKINYINTASKKEETSMVPTPDKDVLGIIMFQILAFIIATGKIINNAIETNSSVVVPAAYMFGLNNPFSDENNDKKTIENIFNNIKNTFSTTSYYYNKGINFNCSFSADDIKHLQFAENKVQPDIILHLISICIMKSSTDSFLSSCRPICGILSSVDNVKQCVGEWSDTTTCGQSRQNKTQTYIISTPSSNGGKSCFHENGKTQIIQCPVDCTGSWSDTSTCDVSGFKIQNYNIQTQAINGGNSCPVNLRIGKTSCNPKAADNNIIYTIIIAFIVIISFFVYFKFVYTK
jgi:hypothetical protein